jgi:hypothetical protein
MCRDYFSTFFESRVRRQIASGRQQQKEKRKKRNHDFPARCQYTAAIHMLFIYAERADNMYVLLDVI